MTKISRILLATDYSEASNVAEQYVFRFAMKAGSAIKMIHVTKLAKMTTPIDPLEFAKSPAELRDTELKMLKNHRNELLRSMKITKGSLKCSCVIREGIVSRQIRKEALDWGADLIVVGTHGATGFRRVLFGSHTWRVMKNSEIPVLAIPEKTVFRELKRMVFAVEQRDGEIPAINFLVDLADEFNANVHILHVSNQALSAQFEAKLAANFREEMMKKISSDRINIVQVKGDDIVKGINDYCQSIEADWLVMSPEGFSLLENMVIPDYSITKKMSFYTQTPLLSLPDYYYPKNREFLNSVDLREKSYA